MLKEVVAVLAFCTICHGLDMSMLQPYNLTALVMFHQEDLNHDGVMTLLELETVFDRYDANGNGMESRHEYTTFICDTNPALYQLSHYLYDDWDLDNDHQLERHDYDDLFLRMDTGSRDSMIQSEEFVDYWVATFTKYENMGNHVHGNSGTHGAAACHV